MNESGSETYSTAKDAAVPVRLLGFLCMRLRGDGIRIKTPPKGFFELFFKLMKEPVLFSSVWSEVPVEGCNQPVKELFPERPSLAKNHIV